LPEAECIPDGHRAKAGSSATSDRGHPPGEVSIRQAFVDLKKPAGFPASPARRLSFPVVFV
jgi:hypothetical protein